MYSAGDYGTQSQVEVYTVDSATPFDTLWLDRTIVKNGNFLNTYTNDLYYVSVRRNKEYLPDYNTSDSYYSQQVFDYSLKVYYPNLKDSYEHSAGNSAKTNNSPVYASPISLPTTQIINTLTLHKGDSDYFTFTTDSNGGDLTAEVSEISYNTTNGSIVKQYEIELISDADVEIVDASTPSWTEETTATSTTANGKATLTYSNLEPNQKYYIVVRRPDSSTYDPYHTYNLSVNVEIPTTYSAVLSGNVQLTHTVGESITNLEAFKSAIMESMTCYINDTAVSDTEAIDDVVLYQGGNELTAAMVSVMEANDYTIDVKYNGVAATGGTVTLSVSEAASEAIIAEVSGVTNVLANIPAWDWAACGKIVADARLISEGGTANSTALGVGVNTIKQLTATGIATRGTLDEAAMAANYFYSGDANSSNYFGTTLNVSDAETSIYANISGGDAVIIQLTSKTTPADISLARYVVVVGVDITNHRYKILDPTVNNNEGIWCSQDVIHNGGYNGNNDIAFSGLVIKLF